MKELALIIVGWLFGMLGPIIQRTVEMMRGKKDVKDMIINELKELQFKLISESFHLYSHIGKVDKRLLNWAIPMIEKYEGPVDDVDDQERVDAIKKNSKSSDEKLAKSFPSKSEEESLLMYTFYIPYITAKMDFLVNFSEEFQRRIFSIKTQLGYLNDYIEVMVYYYRKTFDAGMSEENIDILNKEQIGFYEPLGKHLIRIVDTIENFCNTYSK